MGYIKIAYQDILNKIDRDTYGYCEENGSEIGINRLLMRPIARYCTEVQERRDREEAEREFNESNRDEFVNRSSDYDIDKEDNGENDND